MEEVRTTDDPKLLEVLDHGYVRLVESMGNDLSIVRAARVSYDAAWRTGQDSDKDEKLINYLKKNNHTTPFESVEFVFEVKLPIFVVRQWHRHRTWSYNEVSARYTELPEEFYVPDEQIIGVQSSINKQVRDIGINLPISRANTIAGYKQQCEAAFREYRVLLANGWPKELARMVLPFSTYTKMFAKVDLHNLLHFLTLRTHDHAQYEIRVYAQAMMLLIGWVVPVALKAWRAQKEHWSQLEQLPDKYAELLRKNAELREQIAELEEENMGSPGCDK